MTPRHPLAPCSPQLRTPFLLLDSKTSCVSSTVICRSSVATVISSDSGHRQTFENPSCQESDSWKVGGWGIVSMQDWGHFVGVHSSPKQHPVTTTHPIHGVNSGGGYDRQSSPVISPVVGSRGSASPPLLVSSLDRFSCQEPNNVRNPCLVARGHACTLALLGLRKMCNALPDSFECTILLP